jgi:hypothetical protein
VSEQSSSDSVQYGFTAAGISQGQVFPIGITGTSVTVGNPRRI